MKKDLVNIGGFTQDEMLIHELRNEIDSLKKANKELTEQLAIQRVVGRSEQLVCEHPYEYLSFGDDCYCECEKCNTRLS